MTTCESVGGASGEEALALQVRRKTPTVSRPARRVRLKSASSSLIGPFLHFQEFPDPAEHFPKLSRLLPSIVVEPTDGGDVESGELRWPPDDVSSDVREDHAQVAGEVIMLKEHSAV